MLEFLLKIPGCSGGRFDFLDDAAIFSNLKSTMPEQLFCYPRLVVKSQSRAS